MRKKALKRRIEDLSVRNELLDQILRILMHAVNPPGGNYATFALLHHLTAEETAMLNDFWKWVEVQDRMLISKESLTQAFNARAPAKLHGQLEDILRAHQKDQTVQFMRYADIVLGVKSP